MARARPQHGLHLASGADLSRYGPPAGAAGQGPRRRASGCRPTPHHRCPRSPPKPRSPHPPPQKTLTLTATSFAAGARPEFIYKLSADRQGVTFKCKDYRISGPARYKTMSLSHHEFIRRFLLHVLPKGFHRIRHYGFLANGQRTANVEQARALLDRPGHDPAADTASPDNSDGLNPYPHPCPKCGGPMVVIEIFGPGQTPLRAQARDPPAGKAEAA